MLAGTIRRSSRQASERSAPKQHSDSLSGGKYHECQVCKRASPVSDRTYARRYFSDALKALPKAAQKTAKNTVAYEALKWIGAICHRDNLLSDLEPDDRKKQRQITVKPLVEAFFAWTKEVQSAGRFPKGKTLEGINYCINQEEALKVFLNDGDIPLDMGSICRSWLYR